MSTVTDLESYQQFALQQQAQNNAWSAEQAQKQMDFQKEMSNTAHQREVADLKAAGLNPILSANSGASVPNGAAASADTSAAGNVGQILQQVLQAQSAREVAGMYNAATLAAASIAANASMYGADMSYYNTEDHPKTVEEVLAREMLGAATGSGSGGSSGSSGPHSTGNSARDVGAQAMQTAQNLVSSLFGGSSSKSKNTVASSISSLLSRVRKAASDPYQLAFSKFIQRLGPLKGFGLGSQQYGVALSMYKQGKITQLYKFMKQFQVRSSGKKSYSDLLK